ncbi:hypothetical protein [Azorhizobium doebereinerae]|uniref:hypothetical protein n=1 Tax=Azorhizobium doebereinerae TaxID=281091 RepID=UPI00049179EC|nr:hypothetical protein [Azorhizobium doebereinerae]
MADSLNFQPLSFAAFDPALKNMRDAAEREQAQSDVAGGVSLLGIGAPGAAPQGQAATPGTAAAPGQPSPSLLAAVQADPSKLTRLLGSRDAGARAMGALILERLNPAQRPGQFFQTQDGVLYGDPNTQSVKQVYQNTRPKQFIQLQDGTLVAGDAVQGTATPAYQAGPKPPATPPGFQPRAGGGVEPLPGGPEDPAAVAARRSEQAVAAGYQPGTPEFKSLVSTGRLPSASAVAATQPKPLPAAALKMQNEDLEVIQAAQSVNQQLGNAAAQLKNKQLSLGPLTNFIAGAKNWAGNSDQDSRNYASFLATLEKVRNDSLRLNKGVQTEGDAERAWNELFKSINDPEVVQQRIKEITGLNQQAIEFRQNRINQIRTNYGHADLDASTVVPPAQQPTPGGNAGAGAPSAANAPAGTVFRQNGRNYVKQPDGSFVEAQ